MKNALMFALRQHLEAAGATAMALAMFVAINVQGATGDQASAGTTAASASDPSATSGTTTTSTSTSTATDPTQPAADSEDTTSTKKTKSGTLTAQANTTADEDTGGNPDMSEATKSFLGPLNYNVDSQSGKFTYSVPIVVPPARQGAEPKLALGYSSGGGGGWCGVGWGLDIAFIQRDTEKGVPVFSTEAFTITTNRLRGGSTDIRTNYLGYNIFYPQYDDSKGFVSSMGGSLVLISAPGANPLVYRQTIESSFLTYKYYNDNHWEIVDRIGNTMYLGETSTSRLENPKPGWIPGVGQSTFRWGLDKVVDFNGNLTTLSYTKDGGALYLTNISYNGNVAASPTMAPTHTVDFILTNRQDISSSFISGYRMETRKLLSEIQIKVAGQPVRKYQLAYTNSPSTRRTLLTAVTQYGSDFSTALPPVKFNYNVKPFEFGPDTDWLGVTNKSCHWTVNQNNNLVEDCNDNWNHIRLGFNGVAVTALDIDGDGLPDRVMRKYAAPFGTSFDFFDVQRNEGASFVPSTGTYQWATLSNFLEGANWNSPTYTGDDGSTVVETMDLNGDGYPDHIVRGNAHSDVLGVGTDWLVQTNTGLPGAAGFAPVTIWRATAEDSSGVWRSINTPERVGTMDMNGDGLPDRVMRQLGIPYNRFKVQLNTGNGFSDKLIDWGTVYGQDKAADFLYAKNDFDNITTSKIAPRLKAHASSDPVSVYLYNLLSVGTKTLVGSYPQLATLGQLEDALATDFSRIIQGGTIYDPTRFAGVTLKNDTQQMLASQPFTTDIIILNRMLIRDAYGALDATLPTTGWRCISRQSNGTAVMLVDLNGDGLPDRVMRMADAPYTNLVVQFNNGAGFETPENWGALDSQGRTDASWNSPMGADGAHTWAALQDINGDGLPDRIMRKISAPYTNWFVQLNTGSGFAPAVAWNGIDSQGRLNDTGWNNVTSSTSDGKTYVDFFDIDGDGLPDRVMTTYPAPTGKFIVQLNKGPFPDLMCSVSNGLGGTVSATYVPSSKYDNRDKDWSTDPWNEGAKSLLSFPVQTVSQVIVSDGFGGSNVTAYAYKGGYYNAAKHEFRGFHQVTVTDSYGLKTVSYFHQGGGYDGSTKGEYQDQEGKQGLIYLVESYATNDVLMHRTLNKVDIAQLGSGVCFPYYSQVVQMSYADGTHYRATAEQLIYDATTGNLRTNFNLGEVNNVTLSSHTFTDIDPSDNICTETTYKTGGGLLAYKPDVVTVYRAGGTDMHKSRFNYDSRGNVISNEVWLAVGNRWITKEQAQYDSYGNPSHMVNNAGVVTEVTCDSTFHMFPVVETIAPGTAFEMSTFTQFDPRSGRPLLTTNHLGLIGKTDYDVFYRPTVTYVNQQPYGAPTFWRTRTDYYMNGISSGISNNKIYSRIYDPTDPVTGIESFTYLDGLGRTIQTRVESETNNVFRCQDTYFANTGKDDFTPLPYFGAGSAYVARTDSQLGIFNEFDAAGRTAKVTPAVTSTYSASRQRVGSASYTGGDANAPVGSSIIAFSENNDPWVTITTNPLGKVSKAYADAFAHVTNIVNVTSQGNISTRYTYDVSGNITKVVDNSGNQTVITYDSVGRKTGVNDPDMGNWTYVYDDAGRLTDQYDAKNQHIHFSFESGLGRVQYRDTYDAAGVLKRRVTYQYDAAIKTGFDVQRGQLAGVTETSSSCNCIIDQKFWSYDYKGRELKEGMYSASFGTFVVTNRYNEADQVVEVSYPNDVARLLYTYQNGVLKKIQSLKGTGANSETFYELTSINEAGQPCEYLTHNGQVKNRYEYYANSKRLKTISAIKGTTAILNKTYSFDEMSNIKDITDNATGHTGGASGSLQSIQYDDLNRLTAMTDASSSKSYQYDALGNITVNGDTGSGTYTYGSSHPHAVTAANGKTYQYDANGNMTNRNGQTLVYDEENRLIQVTNSAVDVLFGYDYDGARLWKYNKSTDKYTCFIDSYYEYRENDTAGLCYVFANGRRIAAFRPTSDIYNLAEAPLAWDGRLLASAQRMSNHAYAGLMWAFNPKRVQTVTMALVALLTLALFLVGHFWMPTRIRMERREYRFYIQPLWQRAISLLLIPAFLLTTVPAQAAFVPGEVFYYYHSDQIGSSNVITDRSGNVIQQHEYKAYGGDRYTLNNAAGHPEYNSTYLFTSQAFDDDTGLYFYGSRYYDPEIGKFTQCDTLVPSTTDPQTLNRYAYCNNNPLKYSDPTGHFIVAIFFLIVAIAKAAAIGAAIGAIMAAIHGGTTTDIWEATKEGAWTGAMTGVPYVGPLVGPVAIAAIKRQNLQQAALSSIATAVIQWGTSQAIANDLGADLAKSGTAAVKTAEQFYDYAGFEIASGCLQGGVSAAIKGEDMGQGFLSGAASSALDVLKTFGTHLGKYAWAKLKLDHDNFVSGEWKSEADNWEPQRLGKFNWDWGINVKYHTWGQQILRDIVPGYATVVDFNAQKFSKLPDPLLDVDGTTSYHWKDPAPPGFIVDVVKTVAKKGGKAWGEDFLHRNPKIQGQINEYIPDWAGYKLSY